MKVRCLRSAFRTFTAAVWLLAMKSIVRSANSEALQQLSQSEPVVKFRMSLATYAPGDDRRLIELALLPLVDLLDR